MKIKKTAYQRIANAAKKGTGVKLTREEVRMLAKDDAISTVAEHDDLRERGLWEEEVANG
jgi:hypothetical protein